MRSSAQNLTDQPGARRPGTHFQKEANTVVIGTFDERGKVDGRERLGRDRVGRRLAINGVGACPRAAVEIDSCGCGRGQVMKRVVFRLDRPADLAMDRADGRKLKERAPERLDNGGDGRTLTTDDRLLGRISDQHVNASLTADRCP